MFVPNVTAISPVDVDIFHRISENLDLLVALQEKSGITKVIQMHPLVTMDISTKLYGSTSIYIYFS